MFCRKGRSWFGLAGQPHAEGSVTDFAALGCFAIHVAVGSLHLRTSFTLTPPRAGEPSRLILATPPGLFQLAETSPVPCCSKHVVVGGEWVVSSGSSRGGGDYKICKKSCEEVRHVDVDR